MNLSVKRSDLIDLSSVRSDFVDSDKSSDFIADNSLKDFLGFIDS